MPEGVPYYLTIATLLTHLGVISMDMYNMRVFNYGESVQVRLYNKPVVSGNGKSQDLCDCTDLPVDDALKQMREEHSINSSVNRTKNKLYGIARANEWDLFVTLTFDRAVTDSADYNLVSQRTRKWLNNIKNRFCPDLKYLVVPELHADGEHWHIHGLLANVGTLQVVESGVVKNGKMLYNLPGWRYGFSTASYVGDTRKVSAYVCKYITKELAALTQHRKRFWASSNCTRIEDVTESYMLDSQADFFQAYGNDIDHIKSVNLPIGRKVKYIELSSDL